jgi:hypothetical protein
METAFIVALIVAIPIVLFPAALIWYFNIGGIFSAARAAQKAKARKEAPARTK